MKKFVSLVVIATALQFTTAAQAAEACVVEVKVNGMVCDFCARALEKTFGKREDVQDIMVDLDNSLVRVTMADGQMMEDAELRSIITDSGYDIRSIERDC